MSDMRNPTPGNPGPENTTPENATPDSTAPQAAWSGWLATGRGKAVALLAGTAILVGGAFGVQTLAQSKAYEHFRLEAGYEGGMHGGWHGGGWRGRDHARLSEMSDAEIQDHIVRMVRHAAIEIDAAPEQEEQIIALVTTAAMDLKPLRERMQATRAELRGLLTATTIDRAALEALRAARLAEAEEFSKTLVGAAADLAEVLTPQQRLLLVERIGEFRAMRRHRHGG